MDESSRSYNKYGIGYWLMPNLCKIKRLIWLFKKKRDFSLVRFGQKITKGYHKGLFLRGASLTLSSGDNS